MTTNRVAQPDATAAWCAERVKAMNDRAAAETDPDRRRFFEREAASWRDEELFWSAVAASADLDSGVTQ